MTAAAGLEPVSITEPGIYDLPEDTYHADPVPGGSLSFSGAKRLLPPSCPALFRHEQLHGRPPKAAFDFGHAVHSLTLGSGAPIVVIDAEDWRTKAAKEQRDAAYAAGHVPLLAADHARAQLAARAVSDHPIAGELFGTGVGEQSLFWRDARHDLWRRARTDWLTQRNGRHIVVDLKTCQSADPGAIAKTVAQFKYHQQHPWYCDGVRALGLDPDPAFLFVFVEAAPPHLVTVCELDGRAVVEGEAANERALALYRDCTATGTWPAYTTDVPVISLPRWAPSEEIA